jgi:hypothetical protein
MSRILLAILLAVLCAGCGTGTATGGGGSGEDRDDLPDLADPYGDPRTYEGDPFAGFVSVMTMELPAPETFADTSTAAPAARGGWSIQIAACSSEGAASRLVEIVAAESSTPCFMDRVGDYWKVRYGSYASPEAAAADLEVVQAMGFTDAWVVERNPGD